jgi:hypothetical protein
MAKKKAVKKVEKKVEVPKKAPAKAAVKVTGDDANKWVKVKGVKVPLHPSE